MSADLLRIMERTRKEPYYPEKQALYDRALAHECATRGIDLSAFRAAEESADEKAERAYQALKHAHAVVYINAKQHTDAEIDAAFSTLRAFWEHE